MAGSPPSAIFEAQPGHDALLTLLCQQPSGAGGRPGGSLVQLGLASPLKAGGSARTCRGNAGDHYHDAESDFRACVEAVRRAVTETRSNLTLRKADEETGPGSATGAPASAAASSAGLRIAASLFLQGVSLHTAEPAWAARLLRRVSDCGSASDGTGTGSSGCAAAAELLALPAAEPPSPIDLAPDSPENAVPGAGAEASAATSAVAAEVAEAAWPRFKATMHRAPQRFIALLSAGLLDCGATTLAAAAEAAPAEAGASECTTFDGGPPAILLGVTGYRPHSLAATQMGEPSARQVAPSESESESESAPRQAEGDEPTPESATSSDGHTIRAAALTAGKTAPQPGSERALAVGAALSSRFALHLLVAAVARPSSLRGCEEDLTSDICAGAEADAKAAAGGTVTPTLEAAEASLLSSEARSCRDHGGHGTSLQRDSAALEADESACGSGTTKCSSPDLSSVTACSGRACSSTTTSCGSGCSSSSSCWAAPGPDSEPPRSLRRLRRLVQLVRAAIAAGADPRGVDECGCEPIVAALQAEDAQLAAALMIAGAVDGNAPVYVCCGQPRIQPRPRPIRLVQPQAQAQAQAQPQAQAQAAQQRPVEAAELAQGGARAPAAAQLPAPRVAAAGGAGAPARVGVEPAGAPAGAWARNGRDGAFPREAVASAIAAAASAAGAADAPIAVPRQVLLETPSARALPPEMRCSAAWQRLGHHCFHLAAGARAVRPNHMSLLRYLAAYAPYAQAPLLSSPPASAWWTYGEAAAAGAGAGSWELWRRTTTARRTSSERSSRSSSGSGSEQSALSVDSSSASAETRASAARAASPECHWCGSSCHACGNVPTVGDVECVCDSNVCCMDHDVISASDDDDGSLPARLSHGCGSAIPLSSTSGLGSRSLTGGVVACEACGELVRCRDTGSGPDMHRAAGSTGADVGSSHLSRMTYADVLQLMRLAVYRCGADPIGASSAGWQAELRIRLNVEERWQRAQAAQVEAAAAGAEAHRAVAGAAAPPNHYDGGPLAQLPQQQAEESAAPTYYDSMQAGFAYIAQRYFGRSRPDVLQAILSNTVVGGLGDRAWVRRARVITARVRALEED